MIEKQALQIALRNIPCKSRIQSIHISRSHDTEHRLKGVDVQMIPRAFAQASFYNQFLVIRHHEGRQVQQGGNGVKGAPTHDHDLWIHVSEHWLKWL